MRLAEIRTAALSVDEVIAARVTGDEVGGTVVFVGTVRDDDHGRSVDRLDYSAHPTAAERAAAGGDRGRGDRRPASRSPRCTGSASWQIGDLAVVVAVGCAHRGRGIRVGRVLIDRIKAEVPLWKRQWFRDGEQEWVGACD